MAGWECVSEDHGISTHRLEVPGGWLYRVTAGDAGAMAVTFAPAGDEADGDDEKADHLPRADD